MEAPGDISQSVRMARRSIYGLPGQLNIASPESGVSTPSAPTTTKTPRDTSPLFSGRPGSKRLRRFTREGTLKRTKVSEKDLEDSSASQPNLSSVDAASGPKAQYDPALTKMHSLSPGMIMEALSDDTETIIAGPVSTVEQVGKKPEKETTIPHDSQELRALTLETETSQEIHSAFIGPLQRFGKLTTVNGSFWNSTFHLQERITTFGRDPSCTYVYPDPKDVRVLKNALYVFFWRPGIERAINRGEDWTLMNNLYALVFTNATHGIHVNGVRLPNGSGSEGWKYGKVYTGDIISVCEAKAKGWSLQFMCEFGIGVSKERRKEGDVFVVKTETEKWAANEARKLKAKMGEQSRGEASSKGLHL